MADRAEARADVRRRLDIPDDALVFGIVGSLAWVRRAGYCYGLELARALEKVDRPDVHALIVGDGTGKARLDALAGKVSGARCVLTGRVPREEVPRYLAAMDVASLPQSLDGVGLFRYSTKLAEYLAAGLPVVTGRLPLAYDLDTGWLWRLPGKAPWDARYVEALASLMARLDPAELASKRSAVPLDPPEFDRARQVARVSAFIGDLMADGQG
jgi:glycosyltransferase involved in cell wall biosynthesis